MLAQYLCRIFLTSQPLTQPIIVKLKKKCVIDSSGKAERLFTFVLKLVIYDGPWTMNHCTAMVPTSHWVYKKY